jgi:hypothetical protein
MEGGDESGDWSGDRVSPPTDTEKLEERKGGVWKGGVW